MRKKSLVRRKCAKYLKYHGSERLQEVMSPKGKSHVNQGCDRFSMVLYSVTVIPPQCSAIEMLSANPLAPMTAASALQTIPQAKAPIRERPQSRSNLRANASTFATGVVFI